MYLRPILSCQTQGHRLAGGKKFFSQVEIITRKQDGRIERCQTEADSLPSWGEERLETLLRRCGRSVDARGDLSFERPLIMGVLNVTADSFFDGGRFFSADKAIEHGESLIEQGCDLLDVGAESTRPKSHPISADEQCRRLLPALNHFSKRCPLSVDTRNSEVMKFALENGACVINDVSGLTGDPRSWQTMTETECPIIVTHMQGVPQTMQDNPTYDHAALDIFDWFEQRIDWCRSRGIAAERLVIDPGIGFGKTLRHNLEILRDSALFHGLGCPLAIGVSRKSLIGAMSRDEPAEERLPGSIALNLFAVDQGVQILRVHDVKETRQALTIWDRLRHA